MVSKILKFGKQKGSSLALPANGLGGSRATSLLVAHFALQNTASNSAKKKESSPRGRGGRGVWGEFRHALAPDGNFFGGIFLKLTLYILKQFSQIVHRCFIQTD